MFQRVGHPSTAFESLSREEEARGEVTEYREVVENNPAYLYCDTNAIPPPELTWYREGRPLSTSADHRASVLQGRLGAECCCLVTAGNFAVQGPKWRAPGSPGPGAG